MELNLDTEKLTIEGLFRISEERKNKIIHTIVECFEICSEKLIDMNKGYVFSHMAFFIYNKFKNEFSDNELCYLFFLLGSFYLYEKSNSHKIIIGKN